MHIVNCLLHLGSGEDYSIDGNIELKMLYREFLERKYRENRLEGMSGRFLGRLR